MHQKSVPAADPEVTKAALGINKKRGGGGSRRKRAPWENGLPYDAIGSLAIGYLGRDALWARDWMVRHWGSRLAESRKMLEQWGTRITEWMARDPVNHGAWVMFHEDADKWERVCPADFDRWDSWVLTLDDAFLQRMQALSNSIPTAPATLPQDLCGLEEDSDFWCSALADNFGEHASLIPPSDFEKTDHHDSQWRVVLHVLSTTQPRGHSVVLSSTAIGNRVAEIRERARAVFGPQAPIPVLLLHVNIM
jgi:hypothetical protein